MRATTSTSNIPIITTMKDREATISSNDDRELGDETPAGGAPEESQITTTTSTVARSPSHANRLSMEDYYTRHSLTITSRSLLSTVTSAVNMSSVTVPIPNSPPREAPPSYETAMSLSHSHVTTTTTSSAPNLLRKKPNSIQPREDEGCEQLPGYSSSISVEAVFSKKMELEGAIHKAHDRNWGRIYVTLQGTALSLYTFTSPGMLAKHQLAQKTPDLPSGTKRGVLVKSYNLQHADVGIAADYLKRPYVIRVRAEGDQFLLSCKRIETFVQWLQSLCAAIDLAPPLDEREIPKDHSVPRSGRVRRRPAVVATPTPAVDSTRSSATSLALSSDEANPEIEAVELTSTTSSAHEPIAQTHTRARPTHSHTNSQQILQELASSGPTNPSVSPTDGKWRPVHKWGPTYDMMYARRCMAILTHRSPRKSNMVIMKGTQWVVDWATGALTRWGPPDYGEVEAAGAGGYGSGSSASSSGTATPEPFPEAIGIAL
ncbi:hypothetical protein PVAG01_04507 [Phlyctema vagabunda]|uniref:PH domain-containing protein n=1 Tax=Phlyctema vagabunda TaxID=108571 RepID=A0ABR4PQP5_9HELO